MATIPDLDPAPPPEPDPDAIPPALRRFTVDEYHQLADLGILGPDERVELLEGVVYLKGVPGRRRFNVEEYERMADAGILTDDERVELIDGDILEISRIGSPHGGLVKILSRRLFLGIGERAIVAVQDPVRLNNMTEPEPDIQVLRDRDDFYYESHPTPDDLYLLIEVMDSSATYDRRVKLPRYARQGIREVWLFDVNRRRVEIYRNPAGGAYAEVAVVEAGGTFAPAAFPDVVLDFNDIFRR